MFVSLFFLFNIDEQMMKYCDTGGIRTSKTYLPGLAVHHLIHLATRPPGHRLWCTIDSPVFVSFLFLFNIHVQMPNIVTLAKDTSND